MSRSPACAALEALAIHRHNDKLTQRIKEVLEKKNNPRLSQPLPQKFQQDEQSQA